MAQPNNENINYDVKKSPSYVLNLIGTTPQPSSENLRDTKNVQGSTLSLSVVNNLRGLVENMSVPPNPNKTVIKLQLGDPTVLGNWTPPKEAIAAVRNALSNRTDIHGYPASVGLKEARQAIAANVNASSQNPISADDIIMTCGCSHAIMLAVEALADPGCNMLVPKPGFPLYTSLLRLRDVEARGYLLEPTNKWQANLKQMESLIDGNTTAIFLNNPSNPCGSNYSKEHLQDILQLADTYRLPIIADEIYGYMTYNGSVFYPLESLTPRVPILQVDTMSKKYCMPGWRVGWIIIRDVDQRLDRVRKALTNLCAVKLFGPFSPAQASIPDIIKNTPLSYFQSMKTRVEKNAEICYSILSKTVGLDPIRPYGALYMMVIMKLDVLKGIRDEMQFIQHLIKDQSVYMLPATIFHSAEPGVRVVLTGTEQDMKEACLRIQKFCSDHVKPLK